MRILVVDDETLARDRLKRMLAGMESCEWVGEAANGLEAIERVRALEPDLLLLDIRMPGMDGLEAASHLAQLEDPPAVVFCTAYEEHAIDAFNLQAVGYLLKPVRRERLEQVLANAKRVNRAQLQALSQVDGSRRTHISTRTYKGLELIAVDDVRFLQADSKYVTIRHGTGEVLVDEALRDLEAEFGELFVRIHRSALVGVRFITGIEKSADGQHRLRLRDVEMSLDISRRHLPDVRKLVKSL